MHGQTGVASRLGRDRMILQPLGCRCGWAHPGVGVHAGSRKSDTAKLAETTQRVLYVQISEKSFDCSWISASTTDYENTSVDIPAYHLVSHHI